MKSRLITSHSHVLATDFIMPVSQEHRLFLEGIDDDKVLIEDRVENFESLNTSN